MKFGLLSNWRLNRIKTFVSDIYNVDICQPFLHLFNFHLYTNLFHKVFLRTLFFTKLYVVNATFYKTFFPQFHSILIKFIHSFFQNKYFLAKLF